MGEYYMGKESLIIDAKFSVSQFLPREFIWRPRLVIWFLLELILKVCITKLFNDFCNFLLKVGVNVLPTNLTKAQYRFYPVQK
jgi:hypothetical protein